MTTLCRGSSSISDGFETYEIVISGVSDILSMYVSGAESNPQTANSVLRSLYTSEFAPTTSNIKGVRILQDPSGIRFVLKIARGWEVLSRFIQKRDGPFVVKKTPDCIQITCRGETLSLPLESLGEIPIGGDE